MAKKTTKKQSSAALLPNRVDGAIRLIRGEKVLLDADLAELYEVETRVLTQAVKRNSGRFPEDFMFQLSKEEFDELKEENHWGGRRYAPYAFTEQGVAMLSSVLKSDRAVQVNIEIMRAFVRLRQMLVDHEELSRKLTSMEKKYDAQFRSVFEAIRRLMLPPNQKTTRKIGFHEKNQKRSK
ncbi:ORF6N domain-containing protein [Calycomorphotria hydatis]|uniref:ORF6N domain protein n=1 Tax=Calycomorphotria hydatis TaxID=2528027 RepID=A0A517T7F3_9PLAN|nr:ORF6N domain-containing protein [Calycomorphotria hydatis]QDT64308.1 ORF6N domain protein [Calycomorphotria hydatis]